MPSLLEKTSVTCSECHKALSGGRDTFGTYDAPLCIDCKLTTSAACIEKKQKELKQLRYELKEAETNADYHRGELIEAENTANEVLEKLKALETELGVLPGQEVR